MSRVKVKLPIISFVSVNCTVKAIVIAVAGAISRWMRVGHFANPNGPALFSDKCAADLELVASVDRQCAGDVAVGTIELDMARRVGDRQRDVIAAPTAGRVR